MYNLAVLEEDLLIVSKWLVRHEDKEIFRQLYRIYKKCLFENKLKYFHQAINMLIVMNEDSTVHYIYYLFDGALTKSMIKEEEPWL